jgi:hypothetical protein
MNEGEGTATSATFERGRSGGAGKLAEIAKTDHGLMVLQMRTLTEALKMVMLPPNLSCLPARLLQPKPCLAIPFFSSKRLKPGSSTLRMTTLFYIAICYNSVGGIF